MHLRGVFRVQISARRLFNVLNAIKCPRTRFSNPIQELDNIVCRLAFFIEVTGIKLAADAAVKVSDVIASVVVRAVEIVNANVFELVAPLASVAVIV